MAPVKTKGVHARGSDWSIRGVAVTLRQRNASSALLVDGARRFEIANTTLEQDHLCFFGPKGGMHDSGTDFQDSSTLQMKSSLWGNIHHNHILWKCSAYDMDVSSNMIFEDNRVESTEAGVIPHGNSISFYDVSSMIILHRLLDLCQTAFRSGDLYRLNLTTNVPDSHSNKVPGGSVPGILPVYIRYLITMRIWYVCGDGGRYTGQPKKCHPGSSVQHA
jgi:hypothetical protein